MFVFGKICDKIGARMTAILSLIVGGFSYIWYGYSSSIASYALSLILVSLFSNVYAWIAGGAYLAKWFPRKKGLALGWATMGNNLASATIVPLIVGLTRFLGGIEWALTAIGIAMIVTAIWAYFTPNTPQEANYTPDNMTPEQYKEYQEKLTNNIEKTHSEWTNKTILRTKQFWLISIGLGLYMLVTVGVMSQLVPRLVSIGFTQDKAILTMTITALIGVVGSYLWGVVDQLLSTRVATYIYGIWYGIAIILNLIPNTIAIYASVFMLGFAIGGNANWPVSLTSTVFGSRNFSKVYSLINPTISVIRMLSFTVLSISLVLTDSYNLAYVFFAGLAFVGAFLIYLVDDKEYAEDL